MKKYGIIRIFFCIHVWEKWDKPLVIVEIKMLIYIFNIDINICIDIMYKIYR